jgi:hypothetical protein
VDIEVDLLDADGVIVSLVAMDLEFWNANRDEIERDAASLGFAVMPQSYPPDTGAAERRIACMAEVAGWLAST